MNKKTLTILAAAVIAVSTVYAQDDDKKTKTKYDMKSLQNLMNGGNISGMPGGMPGMKPAEVEDEYQFQHSVDMKVDLFNKKGELEHTMVYTLHLGKDAKLFGMETTHENTNMQMVYELDKKRMILMSGSEEGKMGFVNIVDDTYMEQEQEEEDMDFSKSGNEKKILDRNCEEWTGSDEEEEYSAWLTTDASFSFAQAYQEMAKAQNKGKGPDRDYPEGMLLEMTNVNTKTGDKTIMKVTEIRENSNVSISTAGWTFYQMGGY